MREKKSGSQARTSLRDFMLADTAKILERAGVGEVPGFGVLKQRAAYRDNPDVVLCSGMLIIIIHLRDVAIIARMYICISLYQS